MKPTLTLRPVEESDCRLLWEWANDPDSRAASFSSDPIPWKSHVKWFALKRGDPHCRHYLACDGSGQPVAQVRFDITGAEAVISVSVAPQERGKGIGAAAISRASREVFSTTNVARVIAFIKPDNLASVRAFAKAGFKPAGDTSVAGHQAVRMDLESTVAAQRPA